MVLRSTYRQLLLVLVIVCSLNLAPVAVGASTAQPDPVSLSFPSPHLGFVLSLYDCTANTCAELRSTSNAGTSWTAVPVPKTLNADLKRVSWGVYDSSYVTLTVHFADAKNGWIYGVVPAVATPSTTDPNWVDRLWSTHDGGQTWRNVRLGALSVTNGVAQMASNGASTYLFGGSYENGHAYIRVTRSNTDQWTNDSPTAIEMPAGGTQVQASFSFAGSEGWFAAGNDRGFIASARLTSGDSWSSWVGPSFKDFGSSFCPITAVTKSVLLAECGNAGWVTPPVSTVPRGWDNGATWLFISYDAGSTFKPFRELSRSNQGYFSMVSGLPTTPAPGTILLPRATNSGPQLVRSTNWGRTWHVVLKQSVSLVVFTNRSDGYAIAQASNRKYASLFATRDAGGHWNRISQ